MWGLDWWHWLTGIPRSSLQVGARWGSGSDPWLCWGHLADGYTMGPLILRDAFCPRQNGKRLTEKRGFWYWFQEILLVTLDCTDCYDWKNFLATSCFFAKQTFNSKNEFFKSSEVQLSPNSQDPQSTGVHQILLVNTRDETLGIFSIFPRPRKPHSPLESWRVSLSMRPSAWEVAMDSGLLAPGGAGDIGVLPKIKWNASMVFFPKKHVM